MLFSRVFIKEKRLFSKLILPFLPLLAYVNAMSYYALLRPLLFTLKPETAHNLAIAALKHRFLPKQHVPSLPVECFGLAFDNPVGLAAGFDKNAEALPGLSQQGFGFLEVGTVTPRPQPGNPKPRLFRLQEDQSVINRFGFNNAGITPFKDHLTARPKNSIIGANIGKNKNSQDAVADYVTLLPIVEPLSDYVTINISSPNTEGLRDLQAKKQLGQLLSALEKARQTTTPLLLKISPDCDEKTYGDIVELAFKHNINGLIVTNTTIQDRKNLASKHAQETGGLSGKALFKRSTDALQIVYQLSEGNLPLIGVGGISSGEDAYAKIKAGASLVQVYSALVYQGFGVVKEIVEYLQMALKRDGFTSIREARGQSSS